MNTKTKDQAMHDNAEAPSDSGAELGQSICSEFTKEDLMKDIESNVEYLAYLHDLVSAVRSPLMNCQDGDLAEIHEAIRDSLGQMMGLCNAASIRLDTLRHHNILCQLMRRGAPIPENWDESF